METPEPTVEKLLGPDDRILRRFYLAPKPMSWREAIVAYRKAHGVSSVNVRSRMSELVKKGYLISMPNAGFSCTGYTCHLYKLTEKGDNYFEEA